MGMISRLTRRALMASVVVFAALFGTLSHAQVDEDELGAWYMYFWNKPAGDRSYGFQGDVQHRNWDSGGDLEQLLIRGGVTWSPEGKNTLFTLGAAHVSSEPYGPSSDSTDEFRIYQEALIPQRLGRKTYLTHRFRFEQRWVDNQDTRLRARYFLALNYPFNQDTLAQGAHYFSFYNELFVNLNQNIGDGRRVSNFDRNRFYLAYGYSFRDNIRLQFGWMQQKSNNVRKSQLQFNLFHTF